MTYIYLNTYPNGYLYVGSHTWNGDGIDPNYFGSSQIAKEYDWKPSKIEILDVVTDQYGAEHDWIIKYCTEFGVAPRVKALHPEFAKNFKDVLLINCHSNCAEFLQTPEIRKKATESMMRNGTCNLNANRAEYAKKAQETREKNGTLQKCINAMHTPEAKAKAKSNRALNPPRIFDEQRVKMLEGQKSYYEEHARKIVDQSGKVYISNVDIAAYIVFRVFSKGEYRPSRGKYNGYVFKPFV